MGYEAAVAELSMRLAGVPLERIDDEVERALERVVELVGSDRASFLQLLPGGSELYLTHSWGLPGVTRATPGTGNFAWYHEQLSKGDVLRFERLPDELPPEAVEERAYVVALPMLSHVVVPLSVCGQYVCALLAGTALGYRSFADSDVAKLRVIGQLLAAAIHRRNLEYELRETLSELRTLQVRLTAENQHLRESLGEAANFEGIVGRSRAIRAVLALAEQVAPMSTTVLLLGETGTGKELVASAIHTRSPRSARALIKVNCAALPPSLIESELFGHEKGAFTGATSQRLGRFELADGGTLLLDEVGELPLEIQAKLLRVLECGEFERVGGVRTRKVDVRILAATNRDLEVEMDEGRFRRDLYYRLSAFPIRVPPLRDRREDVPILVWELIHRRQSQLGRRIERVPEASMQQLTRYAWPGNVRELANVIERALILSAGPVLHLDAAFADASSKGGNGSDRADVVERAHLLGILERCQWRLSGPGNAAEILGLPPSTLRSRIKKLDIKRPTQRRDQ